MIIILIGPPGAGKGTQTELLSQKFHLAHFSIGKILREEYEKGTKEGLKAWKYWGKKGINVPSGISFKLLKKNLEKKPDFILDNFPRTADNLNDLKKYLTKRKLKIDFVFHLNINKNEGVTRLLKRAISDKKSKGKERLDETKPLIRKRFVFGYKKEIDKIIRYFKKQDNLHFINGEQNVKKVFKDIIKIIKKNE